jgi:hypothetical protein
MTFWMTSDVLLSSEPSAIHERSYDEDHKTGDGNASIPIGSYERGCENRSIAANVLKIISSPFCHPSQPPDFLSPYYDLLLRKLALEGKAEKGKGLRRSNLQLGIRPLTSDGQKGPGSLSGASGRS